VVEVAHLVVRWLIGITCQARRSSTARTYPESEGNSMTHSTRVALCDPLLVHDSFWVVVTFFDWMPASIVASQATHGRPPKRPPPLNLNGGGRLNVTASIK
jgi:hypothetical protein